MSLADDVRALALKQAQAWAFARGAFLVGAFLLGGVQWYALRQLDYLVTQGRDVAIHGQQLAVLEIEVKALRAECRAPALETDEPVQEAKRR